MSLKTEQSEPKTDNKIVNLLLHISAFIVAIPVAFFYEPLLWITRVISWCLQWIIHWFSKEESEDSNAGFTHFLRFITTTHPYKGDSTFLHTVEFFANRITLFYGSILVVFLFVPLRGIARLLSKFFIFLLNFISFDEPVDSEQLSFLKKIAFYLKRFFLWIVTPHPYEGDNELIYLFEHHISGEKVGAQRNRNFIFFLVPSLGSFILFVATPFLMGIWFSFTDWTGLNNGNEVWVGFQNYSTIFTDALFIYSFMRTTLYSILNVIVINAVAFSLALLVTQNLKLKNVYRAGFFMPNLIGGLVLGYIWQFVFSSVVPAVGDLVGSDSGIFAHSLIGAAASSGESMGALITVVAWQYAGYIMMIYIAALQNVPQDLIEASKIDGASAIQRLRHIILPLVTQAFTIALFLTLVTSFKQYDTVFALTGGGPSTLMPEWFANLMNVPTYTSVNSLDLMAINIYDTAFSRYRMGIGQAKAIIFFLILMIVSVAQVTYTQKKEVEL